MPLIIKGRAALCIRGVKSAGRNLRIRKVCEEDMDRSAGHRLAEFLRLILADQGAKPTFPDK